MQKKPMKSENTFLAQKHSAAYSS